MSAAQDEKQSAINEVLIYCLRNNRTQLFVGKASIRIVIHHKNQAFVIQADTNLFHSVTPCACSAVCYPKVLCNRSSECFKIIFVRQLSCGKVNCVFILDKLGNQGGFSDMPSAVNGNALKLAAVIKAV